jgi:hypothetical protein
VRSSSHPPLQQLAHEVVLSGQRRSAVVRLTGPALCFALNQNQPAADLVSLPVEADRVADDALQVVPDSFDRRSSGHENLQIGIWIRIKIAIDEIDQYRNFCVRLDKNVAHIIRGEFQQGVP